MANKVYLAMEDTNPHDDYAYESVGVDSDSGLVVLDGADQVINFSFEVMKDIHEALGEFLVEQG